VRKTRNKGIWISKFFLSFLLVTFVFALQGTPVSKGTDVARASELQKDLTASIQWSPTVLKQAAKVVAKNATDAQKLLDGLKAKGVVFLKITSVKPTSIQLRAFKGYKFMAPYLATSAMTGYADWSQKKSKERFSPNLEGQILPRMVTYKPGNCRLTFSLFNSDTWFAPDCKVRSSKPEEYLRASLISFIDNSPVANPSGFFFEYMSILSVVGDRADYEIREGRIYSDALDEIYSQSGMKLKYTAEDGLTGYEVLVGDKKWDLQFVAAKPDPVVLAASARFVTSDGRTWVTFGPK
jgi:hypothetical protein